MAGRSGRRLWAVVLVVSAVLLALAVGVGWRETVPGDDLAETTRLAPALGSPSAVVPSPAPASSSASAASSATPRSWPTQAATATRPVAVDVPRQLDFPRLGLALPVRPTGVNAQGEMALPAHPTILGWYSYGAAPAAAHGTVVIAGHIDSFAYGTGPLVDLIDARPGDSVTVRGSKTYRYRVIAVQRIRKLSLDSDALFTRNGPPLLRIVTCGGPFVPSRGGYLDNLIVTAAPQ